MRLSRRKKSTPPNGAATETKPDGLADNTFQDETREEVSARLADLEMVKKAAAERDAWLEEQEILKDFYEHVVLQDSDEGLPSIQSTLPKWLKSHLLGAYSAGYGHSSVRVGGLVVEIERLVEQVRDLEAVLHKIQQECAVVRGGGLESEASRWRIADWAKKALPPKA